MVAKTGRSFGEPWPRETAHVPMKKPVAVTAPVVLIKSRRLKLRFEIIVDLLGKIGKNVRQISLKEKKGCYLPNFLNRLQL